MKDDKIFLKKKKSVSIITNVIKNFLRNKSKTKLSTWKIITWHIKSNYLATFLDFLKILGLLNSFHGLALKILRNSEKIFVSLKTCFAIYFFWIVILIVLGSPIYYYWEIEEWYCNIVFKFSNNFLFKFSIIMLQQGKYFAFEW